MKSRTKLRSDPPDGGGGMYMRYSFPTGTPNDLFTIALYDFKSSDVRFPPGQETVN